MELRNLVVVLLLVIGGLVLRLGYERGIRDGLAISVTAAYSMNAEGGKEGKQPPSPSREPGHATSTQPEQAGQPEPGQPEGTHENAGGIRDPPLPPPVDSAARQTRPSAVEKGDQATTKGADRWLENQHRAQALQRACPMLAVVRRTIVSGMCDICELLPLLEAYVEEVDVMVEAGSRHGSSTSVILNRHLPRFSSMEIDVQEPLKKLHEYTTRCEAAVAKLKGDNRIVVGDDVRRGLPYPTIPLLFIDTLHNADQLYKELEVLTLPVTQWITFHDSHSFRDHDEANIRRSDVPTVVSGWRGLQTPITHFLTKYSDEWVEEMNYMHCNGFYVMRKRNFQLKIDAPRDGRIKYFQQNAAPFAMTNAAGVIKYAVEVRNWAETGCEASFNAATGTSSGALCSVQRQSNPLVRLYTSLVSTTDTVTLFDRIGVLYGYAVVGPSIFVAGDVPGLDGAVEAMSLITVASARGVNGGNLIVVVEGPTCAVCSAALASLSEYAGIIRATTVARDAMKNAPAAPNVFVSAATVRRYAADETFNAQARIIVFGTALSDATGYAPAGFVLQTALNGGTGVAVFEKEGSEWNHYHTPGSAPPLVEDVPRTTHKFS